MARPRRATIAGVAVTLVLLMTVPSTAGPRSTSGEVGAARGANSQAVDVLQLPVAEQQSLMESEVLTSEALVDLALRRVAADDSARLGLGAVLTVNPEALAQARALDVERARTGTRGPLHGIPMIVKDNVGTMDLPTRAGSLVMADSVPPSDATLVARLRAAGAVILAKANMQEFAAGITTISSLGGATRSPYDADLNPGGSSGGTAVAVTTGMASVGIGTDTCGSIRVPAAFNHLVGLRETRGLSSRAGVIPLALTQDVAGPLGRTVADVATVLDVIAGPDPLDPATDDPARLPRSTTYLAALDGADLAGARIGVFADRVLVEPGDEPVAAVFGQAVGDLQAAGATVVQLPAQDEITTRLTTGVIDEEFREDLSAYLDGLGPDRPVEDIDQILASGVVVPSSLPTLEAAARHRIRDTPPYRAALRRFAELEVLVRQLLDEQSLDALVYPTTRRPPAPLGEDQFGSNCDIAAYTGMPALTVPMGAVDGFPAGIEFLGRPYAEARLLQLGAAYEAATGHRVAPPGGSLPERTATLVHRLAGSDRIATGVRVSHDAWHDHDAAVASEGDLIGTTRAGAVVLASTDAFADALVAVPLAAAVDGPLLLNPAATLEERVAQEIRRVLAPGGIVHLVGGTRVLGSAVRAALADLGYGVIRHAGPNRFATATAVADAVTDRVPTSDAHDGPDGVGVLVADGTNFPDALVAGPAATAMGGPVLLTNGTQLPDETDEWLDDRPELIITAVGGPAAQALPDERSVVGADRIDTALQLAELAFDNPRWVGLASATSYPDAVIGGAHAASREMPLLLTSDPAPSPLEDYLSGLPRAADALIVYGGPAVVPAAAVPADGPFIVNR